MIVPEYPGTRRISLPADYLSLSSQIYADKSGQSKQNWKFSNAGQNSEGIRLIFASAELMYTSAGLKYTSADLKYRNVRLNSTIE